MPNSNFTLLSLSINNQKHQLVLGSRRLKTKTEINNPWIKDGVVSSGSTLHNKPVTFYSNNGLR